MNMLSGAVLALSERAEKLKAFPLNCSSSCKLAINASKCSFPSMVTVAFTLMVNAYSFYNLLLKIVLF
jgi:hypothetical protein